MRGNAVARNYAEVLLELISREGDRATIDRYDALADEFRQIVRDTPSLTSFLANPRIETARKEEMVRTVLHDRVPPTFLRFLEVVVRRGRGPALASIMEEFRVLADEHLDRMRVEVRLARPAGDAVRSRIESALARRFGKTMLVTYVVDEQILGGMVVRAQDEVLDGSLRRRLKEMRRRMAGARLPAVAA